MKNPRSLLPMAIVASMALAGCSSNQTSEAEKMTSYSSKSGVKAELFTVPAEQMSHVKVVAVESSPIPRVLRLTGQVTYNAFHTTPVITPVGGPVSRILVAPGERVQKGQTLLTASSPDYSQLRANYLKARDVSRVAEKNYARAQDLYAHHAISERDLLQAESDRNQAKADLEVSEQALRILGVPHPEDLEKNPPSPELPLPAPIGGVIVERLCSPGQLLQASATQCFTISDMAHVWVLVNVYQNQLAYVHRGDPVAIQTDAYPTVFQGRISYIAAALDPNTRTLQARIDTENPGEKLKKDMWVTAIVQAGKIENALTVPDAAVLRDSENQPFVYILSGETQFARRSVTIGESQNGRTEILTGLKAGDRVVGDGSLFLQFKNSLQQ